MNLRHVIIRCFRRLLLLLKSMRAAVTLLILLMIASAAGTVIPQNLPSFTYVATHGAYLGKIIVWLGLDHLYSVPWFLGVWALVCISVTLCIIDNRRHLWATLTHLKTWGYLLTHAGILLILIYAGFNSQLLTQSAMWLTNISPDSFNASVTHSNNNALPSQSLNEHTPYFQALLPLQLNQAAHQGIIPLSDGRSVIQRFPFSIAFRQLVVERYPDGIIKQYHAQTLLKPLSTTEPAITTDISINQPAFYHGIHIYLSSVQDDHSPFTLNLWSWAPNTHTFDSINLHTQSTEQHGAWRIQTMPLQLQNQVSNTPLLTNEHDSFLKRVVQSEKSINNDVRFAQTLDMHIQQNQTSEVKSFQFLFSPSLEGHILLVRVQAQTDRNWASIRIPTDADGSIGTFVQFMRNLQNPRLRFQAAQAFARSQISSNNKTLTQNLAAIANTIVSTFAQTDQDGQSAWGSVAQLIATSHGKINPDVVQDLLSRVLVGTLQEILSPLNITDHSLAQHYIQAANDLLAAHLTYAPQITQLQFQPQAIFLVKRSMFSILLWMGSLALTLGIIFFAIDKRRKK